MTRDTERLLETVIRAELRELRYRLGRGKGTFGMTNYVTDALWGSWLHAEMVLSEALVKAGLSDGKE